MSVSISTSAAASARVPFVTYVLTIGTFLMVTSEFLVAGVLPEIADAFSVPVAQAGLAITVFALGMIVGPPMVVLLTLRLPRRTVLVVALVVFAIGHVIAALSTAFAVLLAARFLTALMTGAFWGMAPLVVADAAAPQVRTRSLGIVQAGGMLANVIGVPLGAIAGQLAGWRAPFFGLAALAAVAAVAIARLVPADRADRPVPTVRAELAALRSGRLWVVLASCALVTGGVLSVFSYISPLLTDRTGLTAAAVPVALVLFGVASLAGSLIAGRLGDAHPIATVLGCGVLTLASTVGIAAVSTSPVPTLVLFALLGLAGLSANPVLGYLAIRAGGSAPTLASALTPSAFNVGTAVGTGIASFTLTTGLQALGPLLVGVVAGALLLAVFGTSTLFARGRVADPA
ncbi:MFS transporter [Amnibacterium kyonggiense]